ncbi:phosphatidylserine decarboxylase [Cryptosporidium felis]|nr:phosphatidylserine decarboxylase [Cryptosporidium felis]
MSFFPGKIAFFFGTIGVYKYFEKSFMNKISLSVDKEYISDDKKIFLYRSFFGRSRSRFLGKLLNIELPLPFRRRFYGFLINNYLSNDFELGRCNESERVRRFEERLTKTLDSYKSIGEFFTRSIRLENIEIQDVENVNSISSPCEGKMVEFGKIKSDKCVQVKSSTFKVSELLNESFESLTSSSNLHYAIIYLSPKDYHRFHSPANIKVLNIKHISGECFPVFKGIASSLNNLFSLNERVVIESKWEHGKMYIVAVAAHGVSDIRLSCVPKLRTNRRRGPNNSINGKSQIIEYNDFQGCQNKGKFMKGEELGFFGLGSTIIVIFNAPENFSYTVEKGAKVKLGSVIGKVTGGHQIYPEENPQD